MRFVLVHHGEEQDPNATRQERARAVAEELRALGARGERFDAVLAGPTAASMAAAQTIAAALHLEVEARDELAPLTDADLPIEGGLDAGTATQERAWSLVEELKRTQAADAGIVLVTHELSIRALVCRALDMPLNETYRFALEPGSLSVIEYRTLPRERTLLAALNETCHLEGMSANGP